MSGLTVARRGSLARRPLNPGSAGDVFWKGLNWHKRAVGESGGPTYNGVWAAGNVTGPDSNGYMSIAITNPGSAPVAAEMSTTRSGFGYGTYTCVVGTRLDTMHKAIVFGGLFTYDGTQAAALSKNEIDICETSAWGTAIDPVTVAHTYFRDDSNSDGNPESIDNFVSMTTDAVHTHQMVWTPTALTFRSYAGTGTTGTLILQTNASTNIPVPENEQIIFNIWVFDLGGGGVNPATATATTVVIRDFSFVPSA